MAERRIVAVGGGDVFAIWHRVLDLVKPSPRVLWVGTASAVGSSSAATPVSARPSLRRFRNVISRIGAVPSWLSVIAPPASSWRSTNRSSVGILSATSWVA